MENSKIQTLCIEQQKRLTMTGVLSVDGFNEQSINLTLDSGKMQITGDGLKITAFSKTAANLSVDGIIYGVKFSHKKLPFSKRLFK